MNVLLIFFALPIATIILSVVLEKILNCPVLVGATFFAIYLVVTFTAFDASFLVFAIVYAILSWITAWLAKYICKILNNNNTNNQNDNGNEGCGCHQGRREEPINTITITASGDEIGRIRRNNNCNCRR